MIFMKMFKFDYKVPLVNNEVLVPLKNIESPVLEFIYVSEQKLENLNIEFDTRSDNYNSFMKRNYKISDGQQFHQYQQNEQSPLTLIDLT